MTSNEALEIRMDENFKRLEEKIEFKFNLLLEKIENNNNNVERMVRRCDNCPLVPRIEEDEKHLNRLEERQDKSEERQDGFDSLKWYLIAVASIISIFLPFIIPKLLGS